VDKNEHYKPQKRKAHFALVFEGKISIELLMAYAENGVSYEKYFLASNLQSKTP
jgi:hypothetical protein